MASKNTLFSYFKKVEKAPSAQVSPPAADENRSPQVPDKQKASPDSDKKRRSKVQPNGSIKRPKPDSGEKRPKKAAKEDRSGGKKFKRLVVEDSSDEEGSKRSKKRKVSSDDEDQDWKADKEEEEEEAELSESDFSAEDTEPEESEPEEEAPKKKAARKPAAKKVEKKQLDTSFARSENKEAQQNIAQEKVWFHMKLDWLKPEKIRDFEKRRPNEPDYNPHTLHVPSEFIRTLTPAMKQWWEIKQQHFDCVIFIKLGKFYELYHMDAAIGVNELGLIYMNHPEVAHAGFPEAAFARYSNALVEKKYKVARVEQTETPDMMAERCKKMRAPTKYDKVVRREICQISSKGTRLFLAIEGDAASDEHCYLLAVTEGKSSDNKLVFGVCFVDTSIGHFHVGQFEDDRHRSQLRTLLAQNPPSQVLLERGKTSDETRQCISGSGATIEVLAPESEFLTAVTCLTRLHEGRYFEDTEWPAPLAALCASDQRTPAPNAELALNALGGCLWYLQRCKIDMQLVCCKNFHAYQPMNLSTGDVAKQQLSGTMVLDAATLENLDVVCNKETGEAEGSLLSRLDECSMAAGRRLLRQWLCAPLCSAKAICRRQDAISVLLKNPDKCKQVRSVLAQLPDLERLFMKICAYGNALVSAEHPEARAIFYQDFSKTKIGSFLSLLTGFEKALQVLDAFEDAAEKSELLRKLTRNKDNDTLGRFPDYRGVLDFFNTAFDPEDALKTGKITPRKGVDEDFEACCQTLKNLDDELKDHLREMKTKLRCEVKYVGTDKKRYQLEVPEKVSVPSNFELCGSRKGFKRYHTPEAKELLAKVQAAEAEKKQRLLDVNRKIFNKFSSHAETWRAAIECLSILDVLLSLAQYASKEETCMPKIEEPTDQKPPAVIIREGRLPTTTLTDFIANDTVAGEDGKRLMLLTGPNMGGKSTLMRQFGLIVIMAQIGCPVPAEECTMSPVDRIFTRIGAQDHILAGESTFFVEMSETAAILKHATGRSIALIDELGRGTTTFDGAAIASAVLERLVSSECLTIFSTHYHFLVDKFSHHPNVNLAHMSCMAEEEDADSVTLLYKVSEGACPSSYGFNAARLAGLPEALVQHARTKARKLQNHPRKMEAFAQLMRLSDPKNLRSLISGLKDTLA